MKIENIIKSKINTMSKNKIFATRHKAVKYKCNNIVLKYIGATMILTIHKGTDEIGGSCIELATSNTTILLDYGTPLKKESQKLQINKKIDAILISHPHQDHFGEIVNIDTRTPIYCGELSLALMNAARVFTGNEILKNNFKNFEAWESFEIGDFKITPYLVDHSATDAYAFLIEAKGKQVLYSGDFRANGRKAKLFDKMISDKTLKDVDILLMEGTMLQRNNDDFPDENSVEDKIYETMKENKQITFMIGSSQNIDSLVSAYKACKKLNKIFVVDIYTAWILEQMNIKTNNIPDISWKDVKVLKPQKNIGTNYMRTLDHHSDYFDKFPFKIFNKRNIISLDEIAKKPSSYLIKSSPIFIERILEKINQNSANIIYSQWLGYLKEEFNEIKQVELFQTLKDKYNWIYAHTSGHADLSALQKFANAISPKKLIPIHTEHKEKFKEYFENVVILDDNEEYNLEQNLSNNQVNKLNKIFKNDLEEYDATC